MRRTIQVRAFRGEHQYVAECLDSPVVTQAATLDELASNVREAIGLHLDGEDLADLGLAPDPTIVLTFELQAVASCQSGESSPGRTSFEFSPALDFSQFRNAAVT